MLDQRPVVDATGLKGKYDFRLTWASGNNQSADGPAFLDTLERQPGLRLEHKQQQVEILAVDHAEKFPTEN